jgi:effector-binding domain-containing protein
MSDYSITERAAQPYVAIRDSAPMSKIGDVFVPMGAELFAWLAQHQIQPGGPLFWKYDVIDMERKLVIEVGMPIAEPAAGDDRVIAGELPAGRYVSVVHHGHPDSLMAATGALVDWGDSQGVEWDKTDVDGSEHWVSRLEYYLSDPAEQPDLNEWDTELAFKIR